jgi:hypothetical protein
MDETSFEGVTGTMARRAALAKRGAAALHGARLRDGLSPVFFRYSAAGFQAARGR